MNEAGGSSLRSRTKVSNSASVTLNQAPVIGQHLAVSKERQGENNHLPPGGQVPHIDQAEDGARGCKGRLKGQNRTGGP